MRTFFSAGLALALLAIQAGAADTTNAPLAEPGRMPGARLLRPLSLADALDIALQRNGAIRKSSANLEATYGVVVQTRAIALPKLGVSSSYSANRQMATVSPMTLSRMSLSRMSLSRLSISRMSLSPMSLSPMSLSPISHSLRRTGMAR